MMTPFNLLQWSRQWDCLLADMPADQRDAIELHVGRLEQAYEHQRRNANHYLRLILIGGFHQLPLRELAKAEGDFAKVPADGSSLEDRLRHLSQREKARRK